MLLLKYLLQTTGYGLLGLAATIALNNLYKVVRYRRQLGKAGPVNQPAELFASARAAGAEEPVAPQLHWTTAKWAILAAWLPLVLAGGIAVVPSGMGGIRVSQTSGTRPGTLYPGAHFITPMVDTVVLYDIRDQVLTTSSSQRNAGESFTGAKSESTADKGRRPEIFTVQSKEGLNVGMAITVRYRLDAGRLDYIHANLPQPVERELVPPVVASVFRELAPSYTVREVFATKREEIRQMATSRITSRLGADGIIVKEVMLRDIQLPEEYAKGLEDLLLKEQKDEGMTVETSMKAKQVKIAELEAEAAKIQKVKEAEGAAEVHVLQAKSESDAMQYTLPLKEKQIQQSRLEAEARKEATVKNAEAQAEAKVIDSKAEMQRRDLLADSEAGRIRKIAAADNERMKTEAVVLRQNPLLINKIIAERLSDKLQVMMVPSDSKIFFNDVMKGGISPESLDKDKTGQAIEEDDASAGDDTANPTTGQPAMPARRTVVRRR
ncbi:MAG TPA: SPFH domain-containing protein [Candidatus Saccharimonadales bacterium]|jgi:regulator of protease activity HflC (stomatin/prohibitin superfamily)|nr:SPFH domain-containing protein [Candidatus Saccharimonadales bacterium]